MKSILIVDDHDLFREGLKKIIERWPDFEVIGEATNGKEALELMRTLFPDIILMDIFMPIMDGINATQHIIREFPCIRVVMLTASDDDESLFQALSNGACGYILKNTSASRLHSSLQDVVHGEVALSSFMAAKIIHGYKQATSDEPHTHKRSDVDLTDREKQVLELLVEGMTNAEIAKKIHLSEHSVKKYICNILQKLQLKNRVEAVVYAIREDIVQININEPPAERL